MILYTNGCSWTYGGGLGFNPITQRNQRLSSVWPHHLGTLLNAEQVINLADSSGSNPRIVRTTYDWVLNQPEETLSKTVAIIQWTELSRYEYYLPRYKNDPDGWIKCKIGTVCSHIHRPEISSLRREHNDIRLSTYTDLEGVYNLLYCCEALHSLFTSHNIKYYFWSYGANYNRDDYFPPIYKKYFNKFNWLTDGPTWKYSRISEQDQHPSLKGHKELAQIIFDFCCSDAIIV